MKRYLNTLIPLIAVLLIGILLRGMSRTSDTSQVFETINETDENIQETNEIPQENELNVHFLNVGQADCILIESNGHYMLVDAGKNESEQQILDYMNNLGITKLDYIVGTHPHEDHIGSLDSVIASYEIDTVLMSAKSHTTKTFEDVLSAIEQKNLSITIPNQGETYQLGSASFTIVSTGNDYQDNLNNWSIGIKVSYGSTSFLMCGDLEKEGEADIIAAGIDISSTVLKVNHHGSKTSTTPEFLAEVNPAYAVITVGIDNEYGHPTNMVLNRLKQAGSMVLRTDLQGTLIARSNGSDISWNEESGIIPVETMTETAELDKTPEPDAHYVLNTNTLKFHFPECDSTSQMKPKNKKESLLSRTDLISQGYEPCKNCNP